MPTNDVILRFIVDPQTQKQTQKSIQEIEKQLGGVGSVSLESFGGRVFTSQDLQIGKQIVDLSEKWGASVADVAKELANTQQGYNKNRFELEDLADAYKQVNAQAQETTKTTQQFSGILTGVGGFALIRVGRALDQAGKSLLSPIQKFIEFSGETSDVGSRWLADTQRIEQSTARVGEVMAAQILPTLDRAAQLSEQVAALVEAHPELAKAAIGLGAGAVGLGAILTTAGQLAFSISALKSLDLVGKTGLAGGGTAGLGTAALGAGKTLGSVTLVASSVIIGAELGQALGNALGRAAYGQNYQEQNLKDVALTATRITQVPLALLVAQLEKMGGKAGELGQGIAKNITDLDNWRKSILGLGDTAQQAQNQGPSKDAINAYIDFVKAQSDAEQKYMQDRQSIVQDGLQRINDLESSYASQRAQAISNYEAQRAQSETRFALQQTQAAATFALSQQQAEEKYYQQRTTLAQNYNEEVQKAEEQHQLRIRQIQRDSNLKIADLVAARDALGIVRERRRAEQQRQDEEDNYQLQARQRSRDFARQLQQNEQQFRLEQEQRAQDFALRQQQAAANFALQQQQAAEEFQVRLEQMDEQHKAELEQAQQQNREKLDELQRSYNEERVTRRNAFFDQIRDLQDTLIYERETRQAYYKAMEADLVAFLNSYQGQLGSNLPGYGETHAAGGYGPGYVGGGEFVANRSTTRILEQMAGNRLTQGNLIAMLGARNGGTTYNVSFPGGLVTARQMKDYVSNEFSRFTNQVTGMLNG